MTAFEGAFKGPSPNWEWTSVFGSRYFSPDSAFPGSRAWFEGNEYIIALISRGIKLVLAEAVPEWIWHCSCGDWSKVAPQESAGAAGG